MISRVPAIRITLCAAAAIAVASCGNSTSSNACSSAVTQVALDAPKHAQAVSAGFYLYSTPVTSGSVYSVALLGLTDSSAVLTAYEDSCFSLVLSTTTGLQDPKNVIVGTSQSRLSFSVQAANGAVSAPSYVILVAPWPVGFPVNETAALTNDVPFQGQVAAGGTSKYSASGLLAGPTYSISITALTHLGPDASAVLHVFTDSTYTLEHPCVNTPMPTVNAQECRLTFATASATAYFTVVAGSTAVVGAQYVALVSRVTP
jgi:hypothetical protein